VTLRSVLSGSVPTVSIGPRQLRQTVIRGARTDMGMRLALAAVTAIVCMPLWTDRLLDWDGIQYGLALHRFDIHIHQPQPPGSPLYILLGRLAYAFTGDEARALVILATIGAIGTVVCVYDLGRIVFGRDAGLLAAIALMTQPMFWGYAVLANVYTLQALLAALVGLTCWLALRGDRRLVLVSAALLGLAGGVRLDVTVFLFPLWLWTCWRAEPRRRYRLGAVAVLAAAILLWLIPLAEVSGGFGAWLRAAIANQNDTSRNVAPLSRQNLHAVAGNTLRIIFLTTTDGGALVLLALALAGRRLPALLRHRPHRDLPAFSVLWVAPSFLFLWLFDMTVAGHSLIYTVWLFPLGAALVVRAARDRRALLAGSAALVFVQAAIFLLATARTGGPLTVTANELLLDFTAPSLAARQSQLDARLAAMRAAVDPRDTVIVTVNGNIYFRAAMFYLPRFTVIRLDAPEDGPNRAWLRTRDPGFVQVGGTDVRLDPAYRNALIMLPAGPPPRLIPPGATPLTVDGEPPGGLWLLSLGPSPVQYLGYRIMPPRQ
jgi:4-amino-4-deoxy-L-arabinose transferase-like glycosyltransferase